MSSPAVKRLSHFPEFVRARAELAGISGLANKLRYLQAGRGFWSDGPETLALRIRRTLAQMVLQDALEPATWSDPGRDPRAAGDVAASVLVAALSGVADASLLPSIATGATVDQVVKTDMRIAEALAILAQADPEAVAVVQPGIATAAESHGQEYRDQVVATFKREVAKGLNPFSNPLTSTAAKAIAGALAALAAWRLFGR